MFAVGGQTNFLYQFTTIATQNIRGPRSAQNRRDIKERRDSKSTAECELYTASKTFENLGFLTDKHHNLLTESTLKEWALRRKANVSSRTSNIINDAWKKSYVSHESFSKNLEVDANLAAYNTMEQSSVLWSPRFLSNHGSLHNVSYRGFKTKRSYDKDIEETSGVTKWFKEYIFLKPKTLSIGGSKPVMKALESEETPPKVKENIRQAFAEGYYTGMQRRTSFLTIIPIIVLGVVIYMISRTYRNMMNPMNTNEVQPEEVTVTFDDVFGVEEAKQELQEIVEFLKNPEKFTSLGAELPKGVLLVGPPGTGKTLLARAVAGQAGVPFFHSQGAEFDELFVGQGARRVRNLFKAAKTKAPCVIFIDEIDSVGFQRKSTVLNPHANQTINQLLSEMDGFIKNEGVIILGATNRRDDLDNALLRPGRFDVEIHVPPPDLAGRKEIFDYYLTKVKIGPDSDAEVLARATTGFTGADIKNLVNQAALKAARDQVDEISLKHLEYARDKILMGPERKSRIPDDEANWITAYHEGGHTIVSHFTQDSTPIHKVTIIPRGSSLGHTAYIPSKENYHLTRSQMLASIDSLMGGRAAEEIIYGNEKVTSGASSDLQQATSIAERMVKDYGMSDKVGLRTFKEQASYQGSETIGASTKENIDLEIRKVLHDSYERAKQILKDHAREHKALAEALMQYETLDADDVKAILDGRSVAKDL